MRLLGRLLTLLLVLAASTLAVRAAWAIISRQVPAVSIDDTDFRATHASVVYPISGQLAPRFRFSRPQPTVRLITHADLQPGAPGAGYSLHLQAFDAGGSQVFSRQLHFRSVVLYARDRKGRIVPQNFYGDSAYTPSASDITTIDFDRPVVEVQVKAGSLEPGTERLAVRVQERRPVSQRQLQVGWDRLSKIEQRRLAEGNAFPAEMLTAAERRSLLLNRWFPVGPSGVQGRDYARAVLYEREAQTVDRATGGAVRGSSGS